MAFLPTASNAIACADCRLVEAITIAERTLSGYEMAHSIACMPPIEPPVTEWSFSTPRCSTSLTCTRTISAMVMMGKLSPYGFPVFGFFDMGPVVPLHPPRTFEQMMKYFVVSKALPSPTMLSHHPGFLSSAEFLPGNVGRLRKAHGR